MDIFAEWCKQNCLDLKPSKTKELVVDLRKVVSIIPTQLVNNKPIYTLEVLAGGQERRSLATKQFV